MDRLLVTGGSRLAGTVQVSGAKNSALKLMAASLLAPGRSVITNVPRIRDCAVMAEMLEHLGVSVRLSRGVAELDATTVDGVEAPHELVRQIRASIVILGPLLARCGRARVALPGGDEIGARPVDLHVRGLERMGVRFRSDHGYLVAEAPTLHGASITLDYPSVTATENLLLAAVLAAGTTVIDNAAREPEVADLAAFLTAMGARVDGAGTSTIEVEGVDGPLRGAEHTAVPDRIEVGTWAAAAVATLGDVTVTNAQPEHLELLLTKLDDAGATRQGSAASRRGDRSRFGPAGPSHGGMVVPQSAAGRSGREPGARPGGCGRHRLHRARDHRRRRSEDDLRGADR
jgi:UDP-N-acetylglucosamine 1-carboxyvinyltransferase